MTTLGYGPHRLATAGSWKRWRLIERILWFQLPLINECSSSHFVWDSSPTWLCQKSLFLSFFTELLWTKSINTPWGSPRGVHRMLGFPKVFDHRILFSHGQVLSEHIGRNSALGTTLHSSERSPQQIPWGLLAEGLLHWPLFFISSFCFLSFLFSKALLSFLSELLSWCSPCFPD